MRQTAQVAKKNRSQAPSSRFCAHENPAGGGLMLVEVHHIDAMRHVV
jgi:predicted dehydrogenase